MKIIVFLTMIFCHIIDDFKFQGILASMKCQDWWKKQNLTDEKYQNDYWVALIVHGFSWSFMVQLPILVYRFHTIDNKWAVCFSIVLIVNMIYHITIDNLKANLYKINLIEDQIQHLIQIVFAFWLFILDII